MHRTSLALPGRLLAAAGLAPVLALATAQQPAQEPAQETAQEPAQETAQETVQPEEAPASRGDTPQNDTPQSDTAKAAPRTGRPPVLETGRDLSKIKLPTKAPAPVTRTTPTPGQPAVPSVGPPAPGSAAAAVPTGPVGELVIPAELALHDFGDLREGEIATFELELANSGEGDLRITTTRATCGCTKTELFTLAEDGTRTPYAFEQPIAPGQKLVAKVGVNTTRKKGNWSGSVSFFSNDVTQPDVIQLKANIQAMFEVKPMAYLNFEQVRVGNAKSAEVTVTSQLLDAFALTVDESVLPEFLRVEVQPLEPDAEGRAKTWTVVGHLLETAPELPRWNGPIALKTDVPLPNAQVDADGNPQHHEVTLTAMAQVLGLVTANPFYLSMGIVPPGQTVERSFTIEVHDETFQPVEMPVTITGRTPEENELWAEHATARVERLEDGNFSVTLAIANLPETKAGPFGGNIDVAVGHPTKESLRVPFSGVCRNTVTQPAARPQSVPAPVGRPAGQTPPVQDPASDSGKPVGAGS